MIKSPDRSFAVKPSDRVAHVEYDLEELSKELKMAKAILEDDPKYACRLAVAAAWHYLSVEGVSSEYREPFRRLVLGLENLRNGVSVSFLEREKTGGGNRLPYSYVYYMAKASAAITLAARSVNINDFAQTAAIRLHVSKKELLQFRKNVSSGRLKAHPARRIYDVLVGVHPGDYEKRLNYANHIVSKLQPVSRSEEDGRSIQRRNIQTEILP